MKSPERMADRLRLSGMGPANASFMERIALLPVSERRAALKELAPTDLDAAAVEYSWDLWARPNQLEPPGSWVIWLQLAGRGFGKTRSGAEWIYKRWREGKARRIGLIAPTPADARDVMIEGESGILNVGFPDERPTYFPSKRRLVWPDGAQATIFSGHEPDQARGPQHDTIWGDEIAVWDYARATFDNCMLGLRLGEPRALFTTTPKPLTLLRELVRRPDVVVTRGTTYDNVTNLAETFMREVVAKYEGTTLGQQELYATLLEEAEGALWTREMLNANRVQVCPESVRTVVAVDPAIKSTEESNETGIVGASLARDGHVYIRTDASFRGTPDQWGRRVVAVYDDLQADRVVYEANQGGDMVAHTLRTIRPDLPLEEVHATVDKRARAEPVAALDEQGKVHHVGVFEMMEDQLCTWEPLGGMPSPDRLDARVWAVTALALGRRHTVDFDPDIATAFEAPSQYRGRF